MQAVRTWLRQQPLWLRYQETRREGFAHAWKRARIQAKILGTPPTRTAKSGPVEVRALTWRRDWMNVIWALKSFYHFAQVDYPLYIHDGGLVGDQADRLQAHFPDATIIRSSEADARVAGFLEGRGLARSLAYRQKNPSTRKLFDFFAFSQADYQVCIDSDIVFFRKPELLLVPPGGLPVNRYNKDASYWYSMSLEELNAAFGITPPPLINSGLAVIKCASIDFDSIEAWLANPTLFADAWVTEQTLHALCSARHGVELLPDTYKVDTEPGLTPDLVCKHYPGFFRTHLYHEGMRHLIATGFLDAL